jgi:drug/metabolite transporter (DMT)-like permease
VVVPGLIWGASFLFIAEGLHAVAPMGVTFLRILVGFSVLALVPGARKAVAPADRPAVGLLGVIWVGFPLSMFPFAEQHVTSALTGMLNGATPLFTAAVASGLARRAPSRGVLAGLAVGVAGAVLIAAPTLGEGQNRLTGVLLILAALVSYGFALNLARPLQQRNGALPVVWRALGMGLLLTAPMGVPAVLEGHFTARPTLAILALGALGTGVAYVMAAMAAGRVGATRASATTFIIPVVALLLGMTLRDERVAALSILGGGICLLGAWLINTAPPKNR